MTNERVGQPLSIEHLFVGVVAQLPGSGVLSGAQAWATDGLKSGEASGHGTGVLVYADTQSGVTTWRRHSDDAAVST